MEVNNELNIRIKTMDSNEYKMVLMPTATVGDLKAKIEEVNIFWLQSSFRNSRFQLRSRGLFTKANFWRKGLI